MSIVVSASDILKRAREITDCAIIALSTGKDSLACLDLVVSSGLFARVEAYHMWKIEGLSFRDKYLSYLESRYSIRVKQLPHWDLSNNLRNCAFRPRDANFTETPKIKYRDIEQYMRLAIERPDAIVFQGDKCCDSLQRRAYITQSRGVWVPFRRAYPIGFWSNGQVYGYLKRKKIPLPPDYRFWKTSYGGQLSAEFLIPIRDNYPDDYAKILKMYPDAELEIFRHEQAPQKKREGRTIRKQRERAKAKERREGIQRQGADSSNAPQSDSTGPV